MNLKLGSRFALVAPTIDEAMNTVDLEVVGVVKVALPTAHELLDTQGVNMLVLVLDETRNTDRVVRMLAQKLSRSASKQEPGTGSTTFTGRRRHYTTASSGCCSSSCCAWS